MSPPPPETEAVARDLLSLSREPSRPILGSSATGAYRTSSIDHGLGQFHAPIDAIAVSQSSDLTHPRSETRMNLNSDMEPPASTNKIYDSSLTEQVGFDDLNEGGQPSLHEEDGSIMHDFLQTIMSGGDQLRGTIQVLGLHAMSSILVQTRRLN